MKKNLLTIIILLLTIISGNIDAQNRISISAKTGAIIPVHTTENVLQKNGFSSSVGVGQKIQLNLAVNKNLNPYISFGFFYISKMTLRMNGTFPAVIPGIDRHINSNYEDIIQFPIILGNGFTVVTNNNYDLFFNLELGYSYSKFYINKKVKLNSHLIVIGTGLTFKYNAWEKSKIILSSKINGFDDASKRGSFIEYFSVSVWGGVEFSL